MPHDERTATPITYTEVRAFEIPKSKQLTSTMRSDSSDPRAGSQNPSSFLRTSRSPPPETLSYDTKDRVKAFDQVEVGNNSTTDSQHYDTKSSSEYRDLDSSSYSVRQYGTGSVEALDEKQAQLKYFGDEPIKSDGTSDVDIRKTKYEPYRSSMHDLVPSSGYLGSKYGSDIHCSNGYFKSEDKSQEVVKGPSFEAPVIASYGRAKSDITADRQQKAFRKLVVAPITVLEHSEQVEQVREERGSVEKLDADVACYQKKLPVKVGKVEFGESRQYSGDIRKSIISFPFSFQSLVAPFPDPSLFCISVFFICQPKVSIITDKSETYRLKCSILIAIFCR